MMECRTATDTAVLMLHCSCSCWCGGCWCLHLQSGECVWESWIWGWNHGNRHR